MFLNDRKKFMEKPPYKQCKYNMCFSATFPSPCRGPMTTRLPCALQYSASSFAGPSTRAVAVQVFCFFIFVWFFNVFLQLCLCYATFVFGLSSPICFVADTCVGASPSILQSLTRTLTVLLPLQLPSGGSCCLHAGVEIGMY